jgi:hypothetical protein
VTAFPSSMNTFSRRGTTSMRIVCAYSRMQMSHSRRSRTIFARWEKLFRLRATDWEASSVRWSPFRSHSRPPCHHAISQLKNMPRH